MKSKVKFISIILIVCATVWFLIYSCAVKDPIAPFAPEPGSTGGGSTGGGSTGDGSGGGGGGGSITYKFDWETAGDNLFWMRQTYTDSQAITNVSQTSAATPGAFHGRGYLKCMVHAIPFHANYSKGETFVDLQNALGVAQNLSGKGVIMYVYCPSGAHGTNNAPNGLQIFFKDANWNNAYGRWKNIGEAVPLNQWTKISQICTANASDYEYFQPGFDPTRVRAIGLKYGTSGDGNAKAYDGPIYIDAVNW
jgi:hypothetical protein